MIPAGYSVDQLRALRHVILAPDKEPTPALFQFSAGAGRAGPCPLCESPQKARRLAVLISGHQVCNPCTHAAGLADVTRTLNAIAAVQDWTPTTERETHLLTAATLAADAAWLWAVQRLTPPRPIPPAEPEEPRPAAWTVRAWAAANGIDCPRMGIIPNLVLAAYRGRTVSGAASTGEADAETSAPTSDQQRR